MIAKDIMTRDPDRSKPNKSCRYSQCHSHGKHIALHTPVYDL